MALGRAEAFHNATGRPVSIRKQNGEAREHELWHGNPAWQKHAPDFIIDAPGARPYIRRWDDRQVIVAAEHTARAGRIWLTQAERDHCTITGDFAVVSPHIKENASPNKSWGAERWEKVIADFPIPVYQLGNKPGDQLIYPAKFFHTSTMRHAAAVVARAALVLTNEGGMHHLAAAMDTQAIVVFGSFISPAITGYASHANFSVDTPEGYCGKWQPCRHCENAMATITPDMVKEKALQML